MLNKRSGLLRVLVRREQRQAQSRDGVEEPLGGAGYLGAYLRRQRSRLGAPTAITATAHKLARIVYNLMRYGMAYVKQTEAAYAEQVRERLEKQLRRRAKELGFELKPIEVPAAPAVAE